MALQVNEYCYNFPDSNIPTSSRSRAEEDRRGNVEKGQRKLTWTSRDSIGQRSSFKRSPSRVFSIQNFKMATNMMHPIAIHFFDDDLVEFEVTSNQTIGEVKEMIEERMGAKSFLVPNTRNVLYSGRYGSGKYEASCWRLPTERYIFRNSVAKVFLQMTGVALGIVTSLISCEVGIPSLVFPFAPFLLASKFNGMELS